MALASEQEAQDDEDSQPAAEPRGPRWPHRCHQHRASQEDHDPRRYGDGEVDAAGPEQAAPMKRPSGIAFLLSQLGTGVSAQFAERLVPLGLTPWQVGALRQIAANPGLSQQDLAVRLGAVPSRIVKLLDELEKHGLVERRRSTSDRRHHALHLREAAADQLAEVRRAVSEHDAAVVAPLAAEEIATLRELLGRIAAAQGIDPQVHLGFSPKA